MIRISFLALLLCAFISSADSHKKLTVVFGGKLAPWVLSETNEGITVDILKATMTPLGYEIEHLYYPYARRINAYETGTIDIVSDMNLMTIKEHDLKGYFSDIAYTYENFAFSLKKNEFNFTELSDLENYSLLSWQDATIHLGEAYAKMANNNPRYNETFDQLIQVKMLFSEKFQIIQMDEQIFEYYRSKIITTGDLAASQKVDRFALFGTSPNGFLFKSKIIRDQFNEQLRKIKSSGEYQKIFQRYLGDEVINKQ